MKTLGIFGMIGLFWILLPLGSDTRGRILASLRTTGLNESFGAGFFLGVSVAEAGGSGTDFFAFDLVIGL